MSPRNHRNAKYSCWHGLIPPATAIAGMVATVAIVAPVRATVLNNWNFDTTSRQLTVILPDSVTPDYFLLAEPARIVLDIPHTTLGDVQATQHYGGVIRSIRLSEVPSGSRIVIELAPNARLDPRHAELTASDMGNGQTQWTLLPLLHDAAPARVTAQPAPTPSVTAPSVDAEATEATPAPLPPIDPLSQAAMPEPVEPASDDDAFSHGADQESAPEPTVVEPAPLRSEPIVVVPPTDAVEPAEQLSLPDIANQATVGAVQALPTTPALPPGVRTDAAALAGIGEENRFDTPPEQIPIDPFAPGSQAVVSVPSLEDTDATPAPQVTVPSIADVPDGAIAVQPEGTTISTSAAPNQVRPNQVRPPQAEAISATPAPPTTDVPDGAIAVQPEGTTISTPATPNQVRPNQVRPPRAEAIAVTPTPPTESIATDPATIPPPTTSDQAVAMNSLDMPSIPLPPDTWSDPTTAGLAPNQVRPPTVRGNIQPPVPNVASQLSSTSSNVGVSPPANTIRPPSVAENGSPTVAAPPSPNVATATPPPSTIASVPQVSTELPETLPPPFLDGTGASPEIEQPSIPPPPSRSQGDGTVPFGTPLPQTKSLGHGEGYDPASERSGVAPVGTRVILQYVGAESLVLETPDPVYELLTVAGNVYDPDTGAMLLPSGAQVLGRFEGFDDSGRRFVTEMVIQGDDRRPLLAESDWIMGTPQPNSTNLALGSGIGAAAVTVLAGLSGVGLLGGAAIGAAASMAELPRVVIIEPGQVIEAEVVADILLFNDAPNATGYYK